MTFTDQKGKEFTGHGLYAAVSFDEGKTWPVRKLLTPGKGDFDGGAWTKKFTATPTRAEHGGYLAATQTPDGEIHLISSRLHYRFNLPWLVVGTVTAAPSVNKQVRAEIKNPAPVRAVTRGPKFHWFGYYDKLQFDPSGRYLLSMEVDFEHRSPKADDVINVGMVDLKDKDTWIELGKTRAWCWQQGCMLQWRPGSDSEVLYNDREGDNFVCRIVDIKTRKTRTIPRAIYHLSPCGKFAITADFRRIQDMRPGYGYAGIPDPCKDELAPDKSGIWRVGLDSGKSKFLFSIADVVKIPKPGAVPSDAKHYFNHIECSTDGNRFVFLHRWRMLSGRGSFITRMLSANSDGSDIRLVSSNGGVSHFIWRDPEHISIWHTGAYRLYKDDGSCENTVQWEADNGHQSYLPDTNNEWLISDTYARGRNREIVPYLYHLTSKRVVPLGGFSQPRKYQGEWRCDSHPRFSPDGRTICIDSPHKGNGRQLYLMDISGIIGK
jgi:hypothetical protein